MTEAVEAPGGDPLPGAGTREGEGPGDDLDAPAPEAPPAGAADDEVNRAAQTNGRVGAARHPHPTSRRARASARRAGPPPVAAHVAGAGGGASRRPGPRHMKPASPWRRLLRPAPPVTREGLQRRRHRTMVAMSLAAAAGVGLSLWGTSIVRNSTAGKYVEPATGPDEPGYQAYVVATPTLAVLQSGEDGELAAAALLSLRPGDEGGAVTLVPVATLVTEQEPGSGDEGTDDAEGSEGTGDDATTTTTAESSGTTQPDVAGATVAEAYEDGGVESALAALGAVLGVAVDDAIELDAGAWSSLVEPTGPVTLTLDEAVGVWPSGEVSLPPEQVGAFLAYGGDDADDAARAVRQATFWSAWLEQVGTAGDEALPTDAEGDLARFVASIAREPSTDVLPVVPSEAGGGTLEPDPGPASELIARAVPYPLSPAPGVRVRVRLLNGTRDPDLTADVVPDLVAAGAEITIAGNAPAFDVTETTYTYDDPDDQADAERFAEVLGVGEVVEGDQVSVTTERSGSATTLAAADAPEDEIDMTIVLGSDVRDLIRRLESTG
jgi:LytR cell envelope-related transcriptional attenuator